MESAERKNPVTKRLVGLDFISRKKQYQQLWRTCLRKQTEDHSMLDQQTKQRITAEETARFMDGNFGQLDLTGSPDLTQPLNETFELQDRHGFNRVDESGLAGINQLKELLANPPREVVEELSICSPFPIVPPTQSNSKHGEAQ